MVEIVSLSTATRTLCLLFGLVVLEVMNDIFFQKVFRLINRV